MVLDFSLQMTLLQKTSKKKLSPTYPTALTLFGWRAGQNNAKRKLNAIGRVFMLRTWRVSNLKNNSEEKKT